jgi:hypothetical protein
MNGLAMLGGIAKLLKSLCMINESTETRNDDELENWYRTLNFENLLKKVSIEHKEWQYLAARIRYYHRYITSDYQDRNHREDLENLLCCLRKYVSFCPTRLVQFSLSSEVPLHQEPLTFDESATSFTQKYHISSVQDDTLNLIVKVEVRIKKTCLFREVDIAWQRCTEEDHSDGCCTMLIIVYEHHESNNRGTLKIFNECENLSEQHDLMSQGVVKVYFKTWGSCSITAFLTLYLKFCCFQSQMRQMAGQKCSSKKVKSCEKLAPSLTPGNTSCVQS